ncbi:MAG: AarF/ABC1/UbiB kinase family protein [Bdellovibrionota bacterium]
MKVGQILSFMDGVVPPEYQDIYKKALSRLQIRVRPHPWEAMQAVLETELGKDWDKHFSEFEKDPHGAASIGQVYRARLQDGRDVAVKIQYPEIREALNSDLKNVQALLKTMRTLLPGLDNEQFAGDFIGRLREEVDYLREASNQQQFLNCWKEDDKVIVPAPIHELCRTRILVSEWHRGQTFSDVIRAASAEDKSQFGTTLFRFAFESILRHGLFNADPHPGNYLFLENGRVVFLDFGFVQRYEDSDRKALQQTLRALLNGARGEALWKTIEKELLIPTGTSPNIQTLLLDYILFVAEPYVGSQPFRFSTEFTSKVSELSTQTKLKLAKDIFKSQWHEPKRKGISPLVRILFGLNSLLAALEAENDWREILNRTLS